MRAGQGRPGHGDPALITAGCTWILYGLDGSWRLCLRHESPFPRQIVYYCTKYLPTCMYLIHDGRFWKVSSRFVLIVLNRRLRYTSVNILESIWSTLYILKGYPVRAVAVNKGLAEIFPLIPFHNELHPKPNCASAHPNEYPRTQTPYSRRMGLSTFQTQSSQSPSTAA